MKYLRWYDKDSDLSTLLNFLEGLNENVRAEIAYDLIQIIMNELNTSGDIEISNLSDNYVGEYKRWYDTNLDLHSAIEIIKNLDNEYRSEIISLIMESIVQILAEYQYES